MSMRLGGKKRGDSGFQWLMIGIVLGMGCAFSFGLALYVFEVIEVASSGNETATDGDRVQVQVITATPDPNQTLATQEPTDTENLETEAPATDGVEAGGPDQIAETPTGLPGANTTPDAPPSGETNSTPLPSNSGPTLTPTIGISIANNGQSSDNTDNTGASPTQGIPPAASLPLELTSMLTPLVAVQGGTFKMGTTEDEGNFAINECTTRDGGTCSGGMILDAVPPHDVTLSNFQIERYEVSVAQYVIFLNYLLDQGPEGSRPHLTACGGPCILTIKDNEGQNSDIDFDGTRYTVRLAGVDRSNYPVTFVYWAGAKKYCETVGRFLPSEAQWERAARGANNWIYPWGQQWNPALANTNRSGTSGQGSLEVTAYPEGASTWGAQNMAGNVSEWTEDYFSETLYQERAQSGTVPFDPINQQVSSLKSIRGGGWDTVPLFVRTVHRMAVAPNSPNAALGFRCAAAMP